MHQKPLTQQHSTKNPNATTFLVFVWNDWGKPTVIFPQSASSTSVCTLFTCIRTYIHIVYEHVCMYPCANACIYVCTYMCACACMYVCTSQHYLNLFLPWHRCQAIHSCPRSHINTTIKVANAPATNKRKSLLLLLVQYTANTTQHNTFSHIPASHQTSTTQAVYPNLQPATAYTPSPPNAQPASRSTDTGQSIPQGQVARAWS